MKLQRTWVALATFATIGRRMVFADEGATTTVE